MDWYLIKLSEITENVVRMEQVIEKIENPFIGTIFRYLYLSDFIQTKASKKESTMIF